MAVGLPVSDIRRFFFVRLDVNAAFMFQPWKWKLVEITLHQFQFKLMTFFSNTFLTLNLYVRVISSVYRPETIRQITLEQTDYSRSN